MRGARDTVILARATAERRILVTCDRDFGMLAFKQQLGAPAGILLVRVRPVSPDDLAAALLRVLGSSEVTLEARLTVMSRYRIRQRAMPVPGVS